MVVMSEAEQYAAGSYERLCTRRLATLGSLQNVLCALGVVKGTEDGRPRDRPPKENDCSRRRENTAKWVPEWGTAWKRETGDRAINRQASGTARADERT